MGKARGWPAGVEPLEHTADVGLRAEAGSWRSLLKRLAAGMSVMIEGEDSAVPEMGPTVERTLELVAADGASLLMAWLRELLYLHQVEGLAFRSAAFELVADTELRAAVSLRPAAADPVREIKGVTWHGLRAEERAGTWRAHVIFDV